MDMQPSWNAKMTRRLAIIGVAVAVVALVPSLMAVGAPGSLPGIPSSWKVGGGTPVVRDGSSVSIKGRSFAVTAVYSDAEVTIISYRSTPSDANERVGSIQPPVTLTLDDGTSIPVIGNSPEFADTPEGRRATGEGSLVFAGIPRGVMTGRVEVGGISFGGQSIRGKWSVPVTVDNRAAYDATRTWEGVLHGGSGGGAVTVSSVVRTPSFVVVRGTFDGLSEGEIQAMAPGPYSLVGADGVAVRSSSGRLGFGDGYRSFVMRFGTVAPGSATLQISGGFTRQSSERTSLAEVQIPIP